MDFVSAVVACGDEQDKVPSETANTPPEAANPSHSDGSNFALDESVVFEGTAIDAEDDSTVLLAEWLSGAQFLCATEAPDEMGQAVLCRWVQT